MAALIVGAVIGGALVAAWVWRNNHPPTGNVPPDDSNVVWDYWSSLTFRKWDVQIKTWSNYWARQGFPGGQGPSVSPNEYLDSGVWKGGSPNSWLDNQTAQVTAGASTQIPMTGTNAQVFGVGTFRLQVEVTYTRADGASRTFRMTSNPGSVHQVVIKPLDKKPEDPPALQQTAQIQRGFELPPEDLDPDQQPKILPPASPKVLPSLPDSPEDAEPMAPPPVEADEAEKQADIVVTPAPLILPLLPAAAANRTGTGATGSESEEAEAQRGSLTGPATWQQMGTAGEPPPSRPPAPPEVTPQDEHLTDGGPIGGGGARPDLLSIAQEVGRVERKVAQMMGPPGIDLGLLYQLLSQLLELLAASNAGRAYTVTAPCKEPGEQNPRTFTVTAPGAPSFAEVTLNRIDALAELIREAQLMTVKTCGRTGSTPTNNVTVTAFEVIE